MRQTINNFSLDIFRNDIKKEYNSEEAEIFQDMCFDLLSYQKKDEEFTPFLTKGKDGSIDHYVFNSLNENIIIECKKNNTYELAKSALSQLSTKLTKSLASENSKTNLYKPWFKPSFKHYYFCTSASFSTAKVIDVFKDVTVELFTWNNLKSILERDVCSHYKWISHDIIGIEKLSNIYDGTSEYKHNLYEDKQCFISRVEYNSTHI